MDLEHQFFHNKINTKMILKGIILAFSFLFILFFGVILFGAESYYFLDPYVDTIMSENFSPESFDNVEVGMSENDVHKLIGKPLSVQSDTLPDKAVNKILFYSGDGKIRKENIEMPWYAATDYAWHSFSIRLNGRGKVISKGEGWVYD